MALSKVEFDARRRGNVWIDRFALGLLTGLAMGDCAFAQSLQPLSVETVVAGITAGTSARAAPDGRIFVTEQGDSLANPIRAGRVLVVQGGQLLAQPLLSIDSTTPGGFDALGETGLLSIALHPNFQSNGLFFVHYSDANKDTVIARYRVSAGNPNQADLSTRTVIMRVDQDGAAHKGGNLRFGPDGLLYIGLGDGGGAGDPCRRGQSRTPNDLLPNDATFTCDSDSNFVSTGGNSKSRVLLAKMLRINVDMSTGPGSNGLCAANADGSANYAIPASNPFAGGSGGDDVCDEILDIGLRNPWRYSFDRSNGDLFIGDVGQDSFEEISWRPASTLGSLNFGWNLCEGPNRYPFDGNACSASGVTPPILSYDHQEGQSVVGGVRYRGAIPHIQGRYFYADTYSNKAWFASFNGTWVSELSNLELGTVVSIDEDRNGEILVTIYGFPGRVVRIVDRVFKDGFE
jgi:glucose/arabinose dehydrogenase